MYPCWIIKICHFRNLFWTSNYESNAVGRSRGSIEKSNLDGSNATVIKTKSYEPIGLTIDYEGRKLYWVDDTEGIHYTIERSNLDGSNHEVVYKGVHQQPVFIVTDSDNIYWTDHASYDIWTTNKYAPTKPRSFKSYSSEEPVSLFIRKPTECHILDTDTIEKKSQPKHTENFSYDIPPLVNIPNSENCSMNGYYNEVDKMCKCQLG